MSRYPVLVTFGKMTDKDGAIGYDRALRSFFFQAFVNEDEDTNLPEIWLGAALGEYPTYDALIAEINRQGYKIPKLDQSAIVSMMLEAGHKSEPSMAERLGLIF